MFCACLVVFDWYLFQLIFILKLEFNWSNSFTLSWVDKVTTGTKRFASVIANAVTWLSIALAIIKQFADQVKMRSVLQLIKSISRALQKFDVLTSFFSSFPIRPVIFCLNLNKALLLSSRKLIITASVFKADLYL